MIDQLRAAIGQQRVDNVQAAVMSAYELQVPDDSLDAIFCANALHVMESPRRALAEFMRTLKPGGRLVAPTFCHGIDLPRRLLSRLLSVVSPFVAHTKFSPESLQDLVIAEGFAPRALVVLRGRFPIAYPVADKPGGPA